MENRTRFLFEIIRKTKNLAGQDFPVLIKMNCEDFVDNGLQLEDSIGIAKILVRNGLDCLEISGGIASDSPLRISATGIDNPEDEAYFKSQAEAFKKHINVPVILVGGNRSYEVMSNLIDDGVADLFSMSRPFIREPRLIKRWKDGNLRKAACISCNKCRDNMPLYPLRCHAGLGPAQRESGRGDP